MAAAQVDMVFTTPEVQQGSIVPVVLNFNPEAVQKISIPKMMNATVGETVFFVQISPLTRKNDQADFSADAKVIFIKVPETTVITENFQGSPLELKWQGVKVLPTQAEKKFIFQDFTIPERINFLPWVIGFITLAGLCGLVIYFRRKFLKKKLVREERHKLKQEILGCQSYHDIVILWKNRKFIFEQFPHIEKPFEKLESKLYLVQFKSHQSETDKALILEAYRTFVSEVEGGFNGI